MYKPRLMHVVKTKHYDFIFSSHSSETVNLLMNKADIFYEEAEADLKVKKPKHIPVVVTPDADELLVKFILNPYQKILVAEAVPDFADGSYEQELLKSFRREVYKSVAAQGKNFAFVKNLPFSFIEGYTFAESQKYASEEIRKTEENYIRLLAQAKLDNKFPSWFQASANRDVYPGNEVSVAAASCFTSYLIEKYGYEKYLELWDEVGKLNLLKFTRKIFRGVYGTEIADEWNEFLQTIPLPAALDRLEELEACSSKLFDYDDDDSYYKFCTTTPYGIVWYDDFRHELGLYQQLSFFNDANPLKFYQILGWAEKVTNLTVSPDGRFLAISYVGFGSRKNFTQDIVRVYDLKRKCFLSETFNLRDGQIILLPDGTYGIAGISVEEKFPQLRILYANRINHVALGKVNSESEVLYKKEFNHSYNLQTPVHVGAGELLYLSSSDDCVFLNYWNYMNEEERAWKLNEPNVHTLALYDPIRNLFSYNYSEKDSFERIVVFDIPDKKADILIKQVQSVDLPGGVNSPFMRGNKFYYTEQKFSHGELRSIPFDSLQFKTEYIYAIKELSENKSEYKYEDVTFNNLEEKNQSLYNPIKYQYKGSVKPLMPILNFDVIEGVKYWPGLGLAYNTKADILDNNEFGISLAALYFPFEFNAFFSNLTREEQLGYISQITSFDKNYSLAGFFNNSSLVVDITGGSILKLNKAGNWNWESLLGVSWTHHMLSSLDKVKLSGAITHRAGTDYYDPVMIDSHPQLKSWASYKDSYKTLQLSFNVQFYNVHQYGFSSFEKSGFDIGADFYCLWDYFENKKRIDAKEPGTYLSFMDLLTQLNGTYYITGYIPKLIGLRNNDGWILTFPSVVHMDFFDRSGKAFGVYAETLVFGKEIQNGYAPLLLYFSRVGLKLGYDWSLIYDANKSTIPDLRTIHSIYDIFSKDASWSRCVYAKLDLDFVPVIGELSSWEVKSELFFAFYPKTKGVAVTFAASFEM